MKRQRIFLVFLLVLFAVGCAPKPQSMTISPSTGTLEAAGATLTLKVELLDLNSRPVVTQKPVTWASSNDSVAKVQDGVVTAAASGEATITATFETLSATATITVTIPGSLKIDGAEEVTLEAGASQVFKAALLADNQNPIEGKTINWTSANPAIVAVDETGNVTAQAEGETLITATYLNLTAQVKIKVTPKKVEPAATPAP